MGGNGDFGVEKGDLGLEVGLPVSYWWFFTWGGWNFGGIPVHFRSPQEPSDDDSDDVSTAQAPPPGEKRGGA